MTRALSIGTRIEYGEHVPWENETIWIQATITDVNDSEFQIKADEFDDSIWINKNYADIKPIYTHTLKVTKFNQPSITLSNPHDFELKYYEKHQLLIINNKKVLLYNQENEELIQISEKADIALDNFTVNHAFHFLDKNTGNIHLFKIYRLNYQSFRIQHHLYNIRLNKWNYNGSTTKRKAEPYGVPIYISEPFNKLWLIANECRFELDLESNDFIRFHTKTIPFDCNQTDIIYVKSLQHLYAFNTWSVTETNKRTQDIYYLDLQQNDMNNWKLLDWYKCPCNYAVHAVIANVGHLIFLFDIDNDRIHVIDLLYHRCYVCHRKLPYRFGSVLRGIQSFVTNENEMHFLKEKTHCKISLNDVIPMELVEFYGKIICGLSRKVIGQILPPQDILKLITYYFTRFYLNFNI